MFARSVTTSPQSSPTARVFVLVANPAFCFLLNHLFLCIFATPKGGLYLEHKEVGITQYLLATFLPSQTCRKYLKLRKQQTVSFKAVCFCCKKVVDIAYV